MNDPSPTEGLEPQIRNAVRAVIVRGDAILMQRKWAQGRGDWYTLPGGGQEVQETLEQTLLRECEEEIGATVRIGGLLSVADFFKQRDTTYPSVRHLIEFHFACTLPPDYRPISGPHPDKHQVDVVWLPLSELSQVELFPKGIARHLQALSCSASLGYLGVID